jgi:hypothetical protein
LHGHVPEARIFTSLFTSLPNVPATAVRVLLVTPMFLRANKINTLLIFSCSKHLESPTQAYFHQCLMNYFPAKTKFSMFDHCRGEKFFRLPEQVL